MAPARPPLPTARSLRFQFAGIHSSKRISGAIVAATRQNAGTFTGAAPPRPPGKLNDPAGTEAARVIVALGRAAFARFSQGCWAKDAAADNARARRAAQGRRGPRSILKLAPPRRAGLGCAASFRGVGRTMGPPN